MKRDPNLQKFIDEFAKRAFGRTNTEALEKKICVDCGGPATESKNERSEKEYIISGYCQKCQDSVSG